MEQDTSQNVYIYKNYSTVVLLIFGGVMFGGISYHLLSKCFESEHPEFLCVFFSGLFALMGIASIIEIWRLRIYELDNEKLIVKTISNKHKRTIYLKDIKYYSEIIREGRGLTKKTLVIFTDKYKEYISTEMVLEYEELKSILTKGAKKSKYGEQLFRYEEGKYVSGYIFILFGILSSTVVINTISGLIELYINTQNITAITVTMLKDPEINTKSQVIQLKTQEYKDFDFEITGTYYEVSDVEGISNEITINDRVELIISRNDFDKKITKKKELSFFDKYFDYPTILVYGLKKNDIYFLQPKDVDDETKRQDASKRILIGIVIFSIITLGMSFHGIYLIVRKKPKPPEDEKELENVV